jgi:3-deoxy-manno-octulosonate cytidylyltransferase (CMP-KDO synthetase)
MTKIEPIILIPARMASTRLPDKPMADIHGEPMITHVWRRAMESGLGRVVVAAGEPEIVDAILAAGGEAILTPHDLPSGTDRIHFALNAVDPDRLHNIVVNVQGDLPTLDPHLIHQAIDVLEDADISTLAVEITDAQELDNPNVVKAVISFDGPSDGISQTPDGNRIGGRALYFSRARVPHGDGPAFHHIGLYVYTRSALDMFVELPPSPLELIEKLEQLRALEAGLSIRVATAKTIPLGVDTQEDLDRARVSLARD